MRSLASIQIIKAIESIPDADRIEVAKVLGWSVVIRKNEFQVGQKCVFFEIDSLIPRSSWNDFLADKNKPDAPIRLKTIRLRGQYSQGLAMPLNILNDPEINLEEGQDLTEMLGIEKYEKPIPVQLAGKVRGGFPSIIPRTDEQRIQADPSLVDELQGRMCYWSLKCDGTSGTFLNIEGDHHVCSRNLDLKDDENNVYWRMYRKYNLQNVFDHAGDYGIQGEIAGPGIQGNTMGLDEVQLFVFNIMNLKDRRYLSYNGFKEFCSIYELQTVPIDRVIKVEHTVEELLELSNGLRYPTNGKLAEGWVIRPIEDVYSPTLIGRLSVKVISNAYLLKHGK